MKKQRIFGFKRLAALSLAGLMFLSVPAGTSAASAVPEKPEDVHAGDILVGIATLCGQNDVTVDMGFAYSDGCILNGASMNILNDSLEVYDCGLDDNNMNPESVNKQRFFLVGVDQSQYTNLITLRGQLDSLEQLPEYTEPAAPSMPEPSPTDALPAAPAVSETTVPTQPAEPEQPVDEVSAADTASVASASDTVSAGDTDEQQNGESEKEEKEDKPGFFGKIAGWLGFGKNKKEKEEENEAAVSDSSISDSDVSGSDAASDNIVVEYREELPSGSSADFSEYAVNDTVDNAPDDSYSVQGDSLDQSGSYDEDSDFDVPQSGEPKSSLDAYFFADGQYTPTASLDVRGSLERSLAKAFPEFTFGAINYTTIPAELLASEAVTPSEDKMSCTVTFQPEPVEITHTVFGEQVTAVMVSPLPYAYNVKCARTVGTLPGVTAPAIPTPTVPMDEVPAVVMPMNEATTTAATTASTANPFETTAVPTYEMQTTTETTATTTTTTTTAPTTTTLADLPTVYTDPTTTEMTAPTTAPTTAEFTAPTASEQPDYQVTGDGFVNTRRKRLRLRKGPGCEYGIITYMPKGTPLTILDTSNEKWYYVRLNDGTEGYCWSYYVGYGS